MPRYSKIELKMKGAGEVLCFAKYQAGKDHFVLVDNTKNQYPFITDNQTLNARLLDSAVGVGGNGLIELLPCPGFAYEMVFYDFEGHRGKLCGDGSLCAAALAYRKGIVTSEFTFKAVDGPHRVRITEGNPDKCMVEVQVLTSTPTLEELGEKDFFTVVGETPHYYRFVDDIEHYPLMMDGLSLMNREEYQDIGGTNVNFLQWDSTSEDGMMCVKIRTYERAVKGEILSCGTGTVGAALVAYCNIYKRNSGRKNEKEDIQIKVKSKGGIRTVSFHVQNGQVLSDVWLCGEACEVFTGKLVIQKN